MNTSKKQYIAIVLLLSIIVGSVFMWISVNGIFKDDTRINDSKYYDSITTTYDENSSYDGINFFADRIEKSVYLTSNSGDVKHSWNVNEPFEEIRRFNYPLILNGGDLIYINYKGNIIRYNNNSTIQWENNEIGHHDVDYYNNTLMAFQRQNMYSEELDQLIQDDVIKQLDPETGEFTGKSVSLHNILRDNEDINLSKLYNENLLQGREITNGTIKSGQYRASNDSIKLFHVNSISVLREDYGGEFEKGNMLLSLRNIDKVVLLDWENEEIVWVSEIDLDRQHHPTMTSDGNILIFDNGWETRNYSRAIEITRDNEIVWEYTNDKFHTDYMGSAQELPNGNILITSSGQDWSFEVDREKNVVWELNVSDQEIYDPRGHGGIFRLTRFDSDCIDNVFYGNVTHSRLCN